MKRILSILICSIVLSVLIHSCAKDEYYVDGGIAEAKFDGSILDYLDSKPREFDSIAQIVRIAGMEDMFNNQEFTFFAPRDEDVKDLIGTYTNGGLNRTLYNLGLDTIKTLEDVDGEIWQRYILRHMFNGKKLLKDYPQIDYSLMSVYGGQYYYSMSGNVCNIGVIYNDAKSSDGTSTLKYMGYRQLHIAYVPNLANPSNFQTIPIASSDIQPKNGVIHVLNYLRSQLGYNHSDLANDIIDSKR
jgi:hypothetical protein